MCANNTHTHTHTHAYMYIYIQTLLTWRLSPCARVGRNVVKFHFKRWKLSERWLLGDCLVALQRGNAAVATGVVAEGENTWTDLGWGVVWGFFYFGLIGWRLLISVFSFSKEQLFTCLFVIVHIRVCYTYILHIYIYRISMYYIR